MTEKSAKKPDASLNRLHDQPVRIRRRNLIERHHDGDRRKHKPRAQHQFGVSETIYRQSSVESSILPMRAPQPQRAGRRRFAYPQVLDAAHGNGWLCGDVRFNRRGCRTFDKLGNAGNSRGGKERLDVGFDGPDDHQPAAPHMAQRQSLS